MSKINSELTCISLSSPLHAHFSLTQFTLSERTSRFTALSSKTWFDHVLSTGHLKYQFPLEFKRKNIINNCALGSMEIKTWIKQPFDASSLPSDGLEARRAQAMSAFGLHRVAQGRQTHGTLVLVFKRATEVGLVTAHGFLRWIELKAYSVMNNAVLEVTPCLLICTG